MGHRHCKHDICESLWSVRDTACYGKNTKFESHRSCFYAEYGLTWIRVHYFESRKDCEPQLYRWDPRQKKMYPQFMDSAFYSRDTFEALTNEHGNELWLGRVCAHHRVRTKPESMTNCAVLLKRVMRRDIHPFATQILTRACLEHEFYEPELCEQVIEGTLQGDSNLIRKIDGLVEPKMASLDVDSIEWKMLRAHALFARIHAGNGSWNWMSPFSEYLRYVLSISLSAKTFFDKFGRDRLTRKSPTANRDEAVAGMARLRALAAKRSHVEA